MRILIIIFILKLTLINLAWSTNVQCIYQSIGTNNLGSLYGCSIQNDLNLISPESSTISSVTGTHSSGKTNDDVFVIYMPNKKTPYFPRGFEKYFKNIKFIHFNSNTLKEIHQADLMQFPNLVEIFVYSNEIEVLEEGLFDLNPNLVFVYFPSNKISHIHPQVFDALSNLRYLYLSGNKCISINVGNDPTGVQELIKQVKVKCISPEFTSLETNLNNLIDESKDLNTKNTLVFKEKVEKFEKEFSSSKFRNFRSLKMKVEALKEKSTADSCVKCCTIDGNFTLNSEFYDTKSNLLSEGLKLVDGIVDDLKGFQDDNLDGIKESLEKLSSSFENYKDLKNDLAETKDNFGRFEAKTTKIMEKMVKELEITRYKIMISVDSKIEKIEKRLAAKVEEILEDKLEKIFNAPKLDD